MPRDTVISAALIDAARQLAHAIGRLRFAPPVTHVYHPLDYAWPAHELYLQRYGRSRRKIIFLGMNPGPFGMVQTGVPFGEVAAVKQFLGIDLPIPSPTPCHPKRPITGFDCERSEVSGRRLWGLFAERFGTADAFFRDHFVVNYCPLAFMESSGRNRTPDQLAPGERDALYALCNVHLRRVIEVLQPQWAIGIGGFAWQRLRDATQDAGPQLGQVLHPSPASPAANRDWAGTVTRQMQTLGAWA